MAKRKPTPAERQVRRQRQADAELLHEYAIHCYQIARVEQATELLLPISAIVPVEGKRHAEVIKVAERELVTWWAKMPAAHQKRARIKIERELGKRPVYTGPLESAKPPLRGERYQEPILDEPRGGTIEDLRAPLPEWD